MHASFPEPEISIPEISWKQLFLRLDLENFLKFINLNADFE